MVPDDGTRAANFAPPEVVVHPRPLWTWDLPVRFARAWFAAWGPLFWIPTAMVLTAALLLVGALFLEHRLGALVTGVLVLVALKVSNDRVRRRAEAAVAVPDHPAVRACGQPPSPNW